ncbi:hypothetical protein H0A73_15730, partial [Alcaligenaceae bacterium]|nr:hypothetical protein [Alcaligenaceae bacterium]
LAAMLLHQSDGTFTDFRGKLVALAHGSIFSRNAASSKPGVIQSGKLAGRQDARIDQLEADRKAAERARKVENETAAMDDDAVARESIDKWVRDAGRR